MLSPRGRFGLATGDRPFGAVHGEVAVIDSFTHGCGREPEACARAPYVSGGLTMNATCFVTHVGCSAIAAFMIGAVPSRALAQDRHAHAVSAASAPTLV